MVIPACRNCHDLKDRMPLDSWPAEAVLAAMREVDDRWPGLVRDDWREHGPPSPPEPDLGGLSPMARLYLAKLIRIWHELAAVP